MTTTIHPGFAYDATSILGFGPASAERLPEPAPGEVVIRYGGWSLQELRDSNVGKKLMHDQDRYDVYPWSKKKLPVGIYCLRIPVPESNNKTFDEQLQSLSLDEQVAPVVLIATALLAHRLQAEHDLLKRDFTRCREKTADGYRVVLFWGVGRLFVYNGYWDGNCRESVWLSSVRTS